MVERSDTTGSETLSENASTPAGVAEVAPVRAGGGNLSCDHTRSDVGHIVGHIVAGSLREQGS